MPAKVDTSTLAVTGLEVSNSKSNSKTPETDVERGDQPYRHRWEYINRDDDGDEGFTSLAFDVFKGIFSLCLIAGIIVWAVGVIPTFAFGIMTGMLGLPYIWMVFNSSTFKCLSMGCLTTDEFFEKMEAMYAANDWQLRWTIQCYHNEKRSGGNEHGGGTWKERIDTHKASMELDYYKCNDVSLRVSEANIKEGNIYRFLIEKNVSRGDEVSVKERFIAQNKRDKHFEFTENIIFPPECKADSFLVARDAESLPFLFTTIWYVICNITVIFAIPYDIYFCSKTKVFPIEVRKEFWVYPENHRFQKATCLDDIGGDQGCNEGVGQEPPATANNASGNSSGGESHSSSRSGQSNDGFDDEEMRKAIALSLKENGNSQKAQ